MNPGIRQLNALIFLQGVYVDSDDEESSSDEKSFTDNKQSVPSSKNDISIYTDSDEEESVTLITESIPSSNNISKITPRSELVSYATEEEGMDDDELSDSGYSKSSSDHQDDVSGSRMCVSEVTPLSPVTYHRKLMTVSKSDIKLPPEPKGRCSNSLQEKFHALYLDKKRGKKFNIQKQKNYRNPSFYEKVIQDYDIDEYGTNFPPEIYDPHIWGEESYYDKLPNSTTK